MNASTKESAIEYLNTLADKTLLCPDCYSELDTDDSDNTHGCTNESCANDTYYDKHGNDFS